MAYAPVISLKHTMKRLKNPINFPQITKSAYRALDSLGSMLETLNSGIYRGMDRGVINELDAKIRDAVWKLEDVLESHVLYPTSHGLDEKGVEHEIDSFLKTVKKLREEYNTELRRKPLPAVSPIDNDFGGSKSTTVGLSDLSENIMNELLHGTSDLKNVSLVGMAGVGKTHLATQIYHHPLILQHFDSTVWVRVGPKYQNVINFAVDILTQIESKPRDVLLKENDEDKLIDLLKNSLRGRRYLIVFDDVWGIEVMDHFDVWLPQDRNGSRVLLTTRQERVSGVQAKILQMRFMNNEESWNLLWQNVFVAENFFPSELEKAGRKIAENCEGLPLLILAVANILRGLDKTEEYWNMVAAKKTTTFTDAYEKIYEVLLLSYEFLPQRLKPCFLYMGVFPQSCEIPLSKLIPLCIVEDFLEPSQYEKLERSAMKSMEDLVLRSLAIVCKWSSIAIHRKWSSETARRIKSSKVHSAYWYLCVKEARKNKFFLVLNKLTDVISIESHRRLSVQNNILLGLKEVYDSMAAATSTTRSLLCTGEDHQYPVRVCFDVMLLIRVLDALAIRFYEFPNEVLKLVQLRYLSLTHNGELPSSVSKLKQLQCLILRRHHNIIKLAQRDSSCLPEEIWDMEELRHLRIMGSNLPNPSKEAYLPKLLTLHVNANSCTKDVFRRIPNLKKLRITIELQPDQGAESIRCFEHIRILDELESLKCVVVNPRLSSQAVAPPDHLSNLPRGLKKLSLNGLGYSWKYMTAIGSLYDLEVLKLRCSAFQGRDWETNRVGFHRLEFLLLEDIDLVQWTAQDSRHKINGVYMEIYDKCLPRLNHLIVRNCYRLKMIPLQIGDIRNLERMEVDDCSPSVVASAHQIKEKSKSSKLEVVINSSW